MMKIRPNFKLKINFGFNLKRIIIWEFDTNWKFPIYEILLFLVTMLFFISTRFPFFSSISMINTTIVLIFISIFLFTNSLSVGLYEGEMKLLLSHGISKLGYIFSKFLSNYILVISLSLPAIFIESFINNSYWIFLGYTSYLMVIIFLYLSVYLLITLILRHWLPSALACFLIFLIVRSIYAPPGFDYFGLFLDFKEIFIRYNLNLNLILSDEFIDFEKIAAAITLPFIILFLIAFYVKTRYEIK